MRSVHSVKVAAQRTGLSPHVIRIWERRYGAVKPQRTETKRRLYSDDEVERLRLLRAVTERGHSIGDIAKLSAEKLRALLPAETRDVSMGQERGVTENPWLARAIQSVRDLDAAALEEVLKDANVVMGTQALAMRVIGPLAEKIGELWREGELSAAHEHFATAVIRVFVGHAARQFTGAADGPVIVVVTPIGQLHELGALLAALAAANLGWNVKYLGASLPTADIAGVARQTGARAVALSIVYPEDDARLEGELMQLRELLGEKVALLAGGRAVSAYRVGFKRVNAIISNDLREFMRALDGLRRPG
jgi:MerR family transcriptional regulator, light-induced transcriptional regulator